MNKNLDIIIYGATGYTGKYCIEYLAKFVKQHSNTIKWAIAGRSEKRLVDVRNEIADLLDESLDHIPIIIASTEDESSLISMCSQCRVLMNLVGPYDFHGEPVVKACIETSTHYVDVSGEPQFIEKMHLEYFEEAEQKKVLIVNSCGLGSIPAEMGVIFMSDQFEKGTLNSVENFIMIESGERGARINHGTFDTAINTISKASKIKSIRERLYKKYFPKKFPEFPYKVQSRRYPRKSDDFQRWYVSFWQTDDNAVRRSQSFFYNQYDERPIQFSSQIFFHWALYLLAIPFLVTFVALVKNCACVRNLLLRYPNYLTFGLVSSEGPSRKQVTDSFIEILMLAKGWRSIDEVDKQPPNKVIKGVIRSAGASYVITSKCLIMSAITLLEEREKIPFNGGVCTPAMVFRSTTLIDRLCKNGVNFSLL